MCPFKQVLNGVQYQFPDDNGKAAWRDAVCYDTGCTPDGKLQLNIAGSKASEHACLHDRSNERLLILGMAAHRRVARRARLPFRPFVCPAAAACHASSCRWTVPRAPLLTSPKPCPAASGAARSVHARTMPPYARECAAARSLHPQRDQARRPQPLRSRGTAARFLARRSRKCPDSCLLGGTCHNGTCYCDLTFTGEACSQKLTADGSYAK